MSNSALYDDDILLWSEQQAEIIRRLGRTRRDLPNEFDIENVAEEVESVGRSELAAVESQLQNILVHLMKLAVYPEHEAVRHWKVEVVSFHGEVLRRYVPSMRQRIDWVQLWALARELVVLAADEPNAVEIALSEQPPLPIETLLSKHLDSGALADTIRLAPKRSEL